MALRGDVSTLSLADLLQNLEMHARDGLLQVEGLQGSTRLFFREGRLAMLAYADRAKVVDVLVAAGKVDEATLELAKKKRRRSRRSLGEMLVAMDAVAEQELVDVARARLLDDACELVASDPDTFTFTEGSVPRGVFDPEERRLALALPAGPLLLEAARREDHWRMIRQRVPSDSAHYIVQRAPRYPEEEEGALEAVLHRRLDGTRSVSEATACFPHQRFEAYQLLADWCESRTVRLVDAADMVKLALECAPHDAERAWTVLGRGLSMFPQNQDLLAARVELAERLGEVEAGSEALKVLIHAKWQAGERREASEWLARAKRFDPQDTSIWEKSMALAIEEGRGDDARADGRRLAELYRAPGLHRKAAAVFEALLELDPNALEFVRELARSRADCGELSEAVATLDRYGRVRLAAERYDLAREAFAEILALDPAHEEARRTVAEIDDGAIARRRERRRRLVRQALGAALALVAAVWLGFEVVARRALTDAALAVSRGNLIEDGRYAEAIERLEEVARRFPYTTTGAFDVPARTAQLRIKLARAAPQR